MNRINQSLCAEVVEPCDRPATIKLQTVLAPGTRPAKVFLCAVHALIRVRGHNEYPDEEEPYTLIP